MSAPEPVTSNEPAYPVKRVLLGATGSVASIKVPQLARLIIEKGLNHNLQIEIAVTASNSALHFFRREQLPASVTLYTDKDEWSGWKKIGDPVLHIELRKWANICVVAPLDANTLAKVANGFCDNLLTCVLRAWDMRKPRLVGPAMNPMMWEHPVTSVQLGELRKMGFRVVDPVSKGLACGDVGMGAMAEPETIASVVIEQLLAESD
ncbi:hypothetical protein J3B02_002954 [Coemansia erecta]|uniref:Flavoprotein domain-containing protein n=1 Tax=Coemansia asiatica TaxID=1052880 RepID=A0A9W7XIP7_9FUNG|nr:hypothetical protein LPJ64_004658 [Coemansia asiatica]KAJ2853834.1 hypothetical protein J3B02_002954 [Coemansia erecta]